MLSTVMNADKETDEPCVPPLNRKYFRPAEITKRGQLTKLVSLTSSAIALHAKDRPGSFKHEVILEEICYEQISSLFKAHSRQIFAVRCIGEMFNQ